MALESAVVTTIGIDALAKKWRIGEDCGRAWMA